MSRQNNFLDEFAALLKKYKVDVSVLIDDYGHFPSVEGISFYSPSIYDDESRALLEKEINTTLPAKIYHDNITSTIQSFKE